MAAQASQGRVRVRSRGGPRQAPLPSVLGVRAAAAGRRRGVGTTARPSGPPAVLSACTL